MTFGSTLGTRYRRATVSGRAGESGEGFAHFAFGLDVRDEVTLTGVLSRGCRAIGWPPTRGPRLSSDDGTPWSVFPDGDVLTVVDLTSDGRTEVAIPGHLASVALTPMMPSRSRSPLTATSWSWSMQRPRRFTKCSVRTMGSVGSHAMS